MGTENLKKKSSQNFGAAFKNSLKGIDAVSALKQLTDEISVEEFISQGGDMLDIVAVLPTPDASDIHIVLNAITLMIKRYVAVASAEDKTHCEDVCHTILTTHAASIHKCFNTHKGCIFQLFAAMVQVSFHIAKTVLLSFDKCLKIEKKDHSCRADYIDLLIALLHNDNIFITRTLLEKGIVNGVIAGLAHDKQPSMILLVLNTIAENIVSNVAINKSLKMKVFNTATLNFLCALYNWKGSAEDLKLIQTAVNAVLIPLCTNYKKGIIFFDESYGTSGQKLNPLMFNFLRKIQTPWLAGTSGLVIKILQKCPDLVKPTFEIYKNSFEPRDSDNFYQLCSFLSRFISSFDIVQKLSNANFLMNIIRFKLFPASVLDILKVGTNTECTSQVRVACYDLFVIILEKVLEIFKVIQMKFPTSLQEVTDYMQAELPDLPKLLKIWKSDNNKTTTDEIKKCQMKLADVLLTYCKVFPINFIPDRSITFLDEDIASNSVLYVKALQMNSILFEPSIENVDFQKGIQFILTHKINNFRHVFHTLLNSCHLFDGFEQEIHVWCDAIERIELNNRDPAATAFLLALKHMPDMHDCFETNTESLDLTSVPVSNINFTPIPNMTTCLPALLLHCQSQEDIEYFINQVTVELFHMQTCTRTFHSIIKKYLSLPKSKTSLAHYLKCWSRENRAHALSGNLLGENTLETQLSIAIIQKDNNKRDELLKELIEKCNKIREQNGQVHTFTSSIDDPFNEDANSERRYSDLKSILNCSMMALFYAIQSAEHGCDEQLTSFSIETFNKLCKIIPSDKRELIIKETMRNPILLKEFAKENMILAPLLSNLISLTEDKTQVLAYKKYVCPKLKKMLSEENLKIDTSSFLSLITCLGMNREDARDILTMMVEKDVGKFYKKKKLTFWGKLLVYLLGEVKPELNEIIITKLETLLINLIDVGLETFSIEEAFANFIMYHPHLIQYVNTSYLLEKVSNNLTIALISIQPSTAEFLPKPKCLITALPLVRAILKYAPLIGEKFIRRVYRLVEKNLLEILSSDECSEEQCRDMESKLAESVEPVEDRTKLITYLPELSHILDNSNAEDLCQKICERVSLNDSIKIHSNNCAILTLLHKKARVADNCFTKLINIFLTLNPEERINFKWIHKGLRETITECSAISFAPSSPWQEFVKLCLKDSLSNENILGLETLNILVRVLPGDKCHYNIFKMIISHSKFVEIMLSDTSLKSSLVSILNVFIQGGHVPLAPSHIPLFLSAYNATLSHTDQQLFEIIQHYEVKDVDLHEYKPFLWGASAATYYSVSDSIASKSLNRQPHPSQVTSLLLELFVKRTVTDFPRERCLISTELHTSEPNKYDPSFLLPLFVFLLSPESPVLISKFMNSGALAVTLASLSSRDPSIRKSAYMTLFRFQSHLASVKTEKVGLISNFIDVLRNGISQLMDENSEDDSPQLSSILSIFLARASLIVSNPSHQLYSALHKFFIAKPALDLNKVPEFLVLFHSEHDYNREWILSIIRDGMNTLQDWLLCDRTVIFKILFSFYSSTLCSRNVQGLIIDIINKCMYIEKGRFYLVNGQGLLSWLRDIQYPVSLLETLAKHQKSDPKCFLQTLLVHSLLMSKCSEETQTIVKCLLEFIETNSAENMTLLKRRLETMLIHVERHCGPELVRDARQIVKHSPVYTMPLDRMSDATKVTYYLLTSK